MCVISVDRKCEYTHTSDELQDFTIQGIMGRFTIGRFSSKSRASSQSFNVENDCQQISHESRVVVELRVRIRRIPFFK